MDGAPRPANTLPVWLDARVIRALSKVVESEVASGCPAPLVASRVGEAARAMFPALPLPQVREAVAIALWVGGVEDAAL
jgi:hypothetical protein